MAERGLVVSSVAHAAILAAAVFGLGSAAPRNAEDVPALPVDILTAEEFTQLTMGDTRAQVLEPPRVQADTTEPAPQRPPRDVPVARQEVTPAASAPPPPPPPPPPPRPEPPRAEAPPPPPAEAEPAPTAEAEPEPQPEEPAEAAPPPTPMPAQRPSVPRNFSSRPAPPQPRPEPERQQAQATPQREFNADSIAALIDRREPTRTERSGSQMSETSAAGSDRGNAERLSADERSLLGARIRQQLNGCWNAPIGAPADDTGALVVSVSFSLNQDGTLAGEPRVENSTPHPYFSAYARQAVQAVYSCTPFDLPAHLYSDWRQVKLNFDPAQMQGGGF